MNNSEMIQDTPIKPDGTLSSWDTVDKNNSIILDGDALSTSLNNSDIDHDIDNFTDRSDAKYLNKQIVSVTTYILKKK